MNENSIKSTLFNHCLPRLGLVTECATVSWRFWIPGAPDKNIEAVLITIEYAVRINMVFLSMEQNRSKPARTPFNALSHYSLGSSINPSPLIPRTDSA